MDYIHVFNNIHQFVHAATVYIQLHQAGFLALLGGGTAISAFLEALLTKAKVNSKKVAYSLLMALTFGTSLAAYWLSSVSPSVAITFPWLTVIAGIVHRYAISDLNMKWITPFLRRMSATRSLRLTPQNQPASPDQSDQLV